MASDDPDLRPKAQAADKSRWNWLLLVPIVLPLLTVLYNRDTPRFLGFPAFYWLQLLFVIVGVVSTTIVYQLTKRGE
jgi:uncharacterized membrane protein YhdT